MALTDAQCRKAVPKDKDYKLSDSGGLYLFVTSKGYKSWRFKYRFAGKEKRLIFGPYPDVPLVEARDRRDDARRLLRDDKDPGVEATKKRAASAASAGSTFEKLARAWHQASLAKWSEHQGKLVLRALVRDVFPEIGALPISEVTAPMMINLLRKIEKRGAIETAKRIRTYCSAVFAFGISEGVTETDPAAIVGKALKPNPPKKKQPAFTDLDQARGVLIRSEQDTAQPLTLLASRLLALTAARPGIVRTAPWVEFEGIDWDAPGEDAPDALWRVPASRMKLELDRKGEDAFEHVMPLPRQAVDVLHAVRRLSGRIKLLFPSTRRSIIPMSENAIGYMYNRIGFRGRHVPHGWRAAFSTIMNEWAREHGREGDRAVIDLMLAHVPKGLSSSEAAYNRSQHFARRRELAQIWADMLMKDLGPANDLVDGRVERLVSAGLRPSR